MSYNLVEKKLKANGVVILDGGNGGDIYHSTTLTVNETTGTSINENTNNISLFLENKYLHIKNNYPINKILIYNIQGKIVYQDLLIDNNIDLNHLKRGIYIVNIIDKKQNKFTQKIMLD